MTELEDLLDTTPTPPLTPKKSKRVITAKNGKKKKKGERPGRVPSAKTTQIREKILEAVRRRKNGIPNHELATLLKITPGECLKLAQLLVKQKLIVLKREKGTKLVTLCKP